MGNPAAKLTLRGWAPSPWAILTLCQGSGILPPEPTYLLAILSRSLCWSLCLLSWSCAASSMLRTWNFPQTDGLCGGFPISLTQHSNALSALSPSVPTYLGLEPHQGHLESKWARSPQAFDSSCSLCLEPSQKWIVPGLIFSASPCQRVALACLGVMSAPLWKE
jgi:hypothetical protein